MSLAGTSYRPFDVDKRKLSWRRDDTRMHVDAFPSNPIGERRILRIFRNINAEGQPRHWRVGEAFGDMAEKFLPSSRLFGPLGEPAGRAQDHQGQALGIRPPDAAPARRPEARPRLSGPRPAGGRAFPARRDLGDVLGPRDARRHGRALHAGADRLPRGRRPSRPGEGAAADSGAEVGRPLKH